MSADDGAAFGVAGPVVGQHVELTNDIAQKFNTDF